MRAKLLLSLVFFSCIIFSCKKESDCCVFTPEPPIESSTMVDCDEANSISTVGVECTFPAPDNSNYVETVDGAIRSINCNTVPNHTYGDFRGRFAPFERSFTLPTSPTIAQDITSIFNANNRTRYFFGVATNGVYFAPAPATPFIFENTQTGEYNWDWVFEASMNKGPEQDQVKLDCANAHSGDQGYHYHGQMFAFAEVLSPGITSGSIPDEPVQVGWAADGFPMVYLYGPDSSGNLVKLSSSYRLKEGVRPGDGVSAPCGPYNGKYYNDYQYIDNLGELDECNGIERSITITTPSGRQHFPYFYVVTETFPQIGRCFIGSPDDSFL